jgi:hypothetical protein
VKFTAIMLAASLHGMPSSPALAHDAQHVRARVVRMHSHLWTCFAIDDAGIRKCTPSEARDVLRGKYRLKIRRTD